MNFAYHDKIYKKKYIEGQFYRLRLCFGRFLLNTISIVDHIKI